VLAHGRRQDRDAGGQNELEVRTMSERILGRGRAAQHRPASLLATEIVANRSTEPGRESIVSAGVIVPGSDSTIRCFASRARVRRGRRLSQSTSFQKESFRLIFPSTNSNRSHPRTSIGSPVRWVPRMVHSDTPRSPQSQWRSSS
jgi:hypothetical protein